MAYEILTEAGMRTLIAAVDLSASQYRGINEDTNGKAALPAAGGNIYGVVQNKPAAGQAATIARAPNISKVEVSAAVAAGAILMVAVDGRFLTATATNKGVARAMQAASGAGVLIAAELVDLGTQ